MGEGLGPGAIDASGGCATTTGAKQPVICTLEGPDTVISNGTFGLEAHTAVVLNTSCRDVHFSNITFTGVRIPV